MPKELPYLPSYKNVGLLFEKIRSAKIPEAFTQSYLSDTLGLKSKGDRSLITLLKQLGFLDSTGKPTSEYSALKNEKVAGREIARGVREAFEPLFAANENVHSLEGQELKGTVAQVAGSDANTTTKIVGTFKALVALADFEPSAADVSSDKLGESPEGMNLEQSIEDKAAFEAGGFPSGMRPEFHYNIQVHLPSNASEETYMNIFNAVRRVFK